MISLEKWKISTFSQKLTNNVGGLGKINVATGFEKFPKEHKFAQSGHTADNIRRVKTLLSLATAKNEMIFNVWGVQSEVEVDEKKVFHKTQFLNWKWKIGDVEIEKSKRKRGLNTKKILTRLLKNQNEPEKRNFKLKTEMKHSLLQRRKFENDQINKILD